jgi:hypothetical protein
MATGVTEAKKTTAAELSRMAEAAEALGKMYPHHQAEFEFSRSSATWIASSSFRSASKIMKKI